MSLYVAVALGALLLFLVQPMSARFILPWFGGGPTVWSALQLYGRIGGLAFDTKLTMAALSACK